MNNDMNNVEILRVQIPYYIIADDIEDTPWENFIKGNAKGKDIVEFDIHIPSGRIAGWKQGAMSSTNWKVVDNGIYILLDSSLNEICRKFDCYVPSVLSGMRHETDDYVMLDVTWEGIIQKWSDRQKMIHKIQNKNN